MSYVLPDEPHGAIRPELAVGALWPLLTLMLVGPLAGFAWLAFNSWALGCRQAPRHTVIALCAVPVIGLLVLLIGVPEGAVAGGTPAAGAELTDRLMLIAVNAGALCLAFWIMIDQDDAEQWRKSFGPPPGNGTVAFVVLLVLRLAAGPFVPAPVSAFAFWMVA